MESVYQLLHYMLDALSFDGVLLLLQQWGEKQSQVRFKVRNIFHRNNIPISLKVNAYTIDTFRFNQPWLIAFKPIAGVALAGSTGGSYERNAMS